MFRKLTLLGLSVFFLLTTLSLVKAGDAPVLQQPPNSADCIEKDVDFMWSYPEGATRFRIEVSPTAAFGSHIHDISGLQANHISLSVPSYNAIYFWRVSATFSDNSTSMSSTSAFLTRYTPPALLFPEDEDMCQSGATNFRWNDLADRLAFELQIDDADDFNTPILHETEIGSTTFTYTLPQSGKYYYWRVRGIFANCVSDWSKPFVLRTKSDPPMLQSPANNVSCQPLTIDLNWNADSFASGYNLQISEYQNFATPVVNVTGLSQPTYQATLQKKGTVYYWRVSSSFTYCTGDWSFPYSFKTVDPDPVPMEPAKGDFGISVNGSFNWYVAVPAQSYDLQVATSDDFSSTVMVIDQKGLTSTSFSVAHPFNYNTVYYWRVKAYYEGCETMWSSVYYFKTEYPPVSLLSPSNELECVPINSKFEWTPVTGASSYRLQIAKDAAFTNLVVNKTDIMTTFTNADVPDELTNYYWRVRADDGGNYGKWPNTTFMFKSTIHKPGMTTPKQDATGVQRVSTLRWQQTKPDAEYTVQVASDENFSNLIVNEDELTGLTLDISLNGFNTTYYWRVKSLYLTCPSTWSDTWKFKTALPPPALNFPANNSVKQPLRIGFNWKSEPTATHYSIQVSKNKEFTDIVFSRSGIEVNSVIAGEFAEETTFYWRLNSVNAEGISEWSDYWQFTTGKRGPNAPQLISPPNNSTRQPLIVELKWDKIANADQYHLQISENWVFTSPIVDLNDLTENSYTFTTDQYNKSFYWRVAAINEVGRSAWSDQWVFTTTQEDIDEKVELIAPANRANDIPLDLEFSWKAVQGAVNYHFQLAKDNTFSNIVEENPAVYALKFIKYKLEKTTKYYWRVRAKNDVSEAQWSDIWEFTTWDPASVQDVLPSKYNVNVYPNPFANIAQISFALDNSEDVLLTIHNILGEEIAVLKSGWLNAGNHSFYWNPNNAENGVYWYSLRIGNNRVVNRILLIK